MTATPASRAPAAAHRRGARAAGAAAAAAPAISTPPTPSSGTPTATGSSRCAKVSRVDLDLLQGIDRVRDILLDNTRRFAAGPAGQQRAAVGRARHGQELAGQGGRMPRSTRDNAACAGAGRDPSRGHHQPAAAARAAARRRRRCLLFCDDLSFDQQDTSYKSLKAVLEGGIEGRPDNVVFYATSNRRHLMSRDMIENERSTAINPGEAVEEKVSLSDRFGLWLGFHACDQETYHAMVRGYAERYGLDAAGRTAARRGGGMGDHPRRALGPRRLAIHPGPRRPARQAPALTPEDMTVIRKTQARDFAAARAFAYDHLASVRHAPISCRA